MKKTNCITSKKFDIHAKTNLVQMLMTLHSKNSIKYEIIVITPVSVETLLILLVI